METPPPPPVPNSPTPSETPPLPNPSITATVIPPTENRGFLSFLGNKSETPPSAPLSPVAEKTPPTEVPQNKAPILREYNLSQIDLSPEKAKAITQNVLLLLGTANPHLLEGLTKMVEGKKTQVEQERLALGMTTVMRAFDAQERAENPQYRGLYKEAFARLSAKQTDELLGEAQKVLEKPIATQAGIFASVLDEVKNEQIPQTQGSLRTLVENAVQHSGLDEFEARPIRQGAAIAYKIIDRVYNMPSVEMAAPAPVASAPVTS